MISVPVTFDTANRRKDKSVSLKFTSNLEVTTEDFAEMDRLVGESGWCVFSPNEIQPNQVPEVPADEAYGKMTPSQELRWILKKLYEQNKPDEDWPDYYRRVMGTIIAQAREKLL